MHRKSHRVLRITIAWEVPLHLKLSVQYQIFGRRAHPRCFSVTCDLRMKFELLHILPHMPVCCKRTLICYLQVHVVALKAVLDNSYQIAWESKGGWRIIIYAWYEQTRKHVNHMKVEGRQKNNPGCLRGYHNLL